LGVTQPVVSRKLKVFQSADSCGAILLKESSGAPELTEAGRAMLPAARELVAQYGQLLDYLRGQSNAPQVVRVGLGGFAAEHYLPGALALLRDSAADCELRPAIVRGEERIIGTAEGHFDMAIVTHAPALVERIAAEAAGSRSTLVIEPLAQQPMCVIALRGTPEGDELHSIPRKRAVPLARLREWELVGLDRRSGIRQQLEQELGSPESLSFSAEGGGWLAARECARRGLGVAVLPLAVLSSEDDKDCVIRRLSERFAKADYLIHRRKELNQTQREAKRCLQEAVTAQRKLVQRTWKDLLQA
jgi:DNA-binding transcriptional LysR family regulator